MPPPACGRSSCFSFSCHQEYGGLGEGYAREMGEDGSGSHEEGGRSCGNVWQHLTMVCLMVVVLLVLARDQSPLSCQEVTRFRCILLFLAPLKTAIVTQRRVDTPDKSAQDALRVLDIVLRQRSAERGCLLVRQAFSHNDKNSFDVGGGVIGIQGFHSGLHPIHERLSLNIDVSTTLILKPSPVIDFLLANQNVELHRQIDWFKARKMLKHMRVKASHRNMEFIIIGPSEKHIP